MGFQNLHGISDMEFFRKETQLAVEAEAMGFDFAAPVEHHFTDYAACPDPIQVLTYVAAKTKTIKLMPAAVILPWNDPLRVVEKTAMLDSLSEGRVILGMGRGAARREFTASGVDLGRFARDVRRGRADHHGRARDRHRQGRHQVVQAARASKSVRGRKSPADRMRDGHHVALARLRSRPNTGSSRCASRRATGQARCPRSTATATRSSKRTATKRRRSSSATSSCASRPRQKVIEYTDKYFASCSARSRTTTRSGGEHFKTLPSYATYVALGRDAAARGGPEKAYKDYIDANLIGTPEQLLEKHLARKEMVGDYEIIANFSYGGMPYELVYEQMKRFADKILPKLKG